MKRMITVLCFVFALSALGLANIPRLAQGSEMMKSGEKKATKKAGPAAPKSDTEVQKCISDKFANSEKLKSQGFSVTVSNGEATLAGTANNAGSKGAATRIAKSCGATKVTNNISSPPVAKPKSGDKMKPGEKKM